MHTLRFLAVSLAAMTAAFSLWGCENHDNGTKRLLAYSQSLSALCSGTYSEMAIEEAFDDSNRPNLTLYPDPVNNNYYLSTPWNYEKSYNACRKYPLLIYLHGRDQAGYISNLYYMGYDNPSGYMREEAGAFKKKYPCFTFVPQETGAPFNTTKIINLIEYFRSIYRIDDERIYVHGYSMGGWGSYTLAGDYHKRTGRYFAGIITLNGGAVNLDAAVAARAGVWIMTGLLDTASTTAGRNSYDYLKNLSCNAGAMETTRMDYSVGSYTADTWTLTLNSLEIVKRTEFADVGHSSLGFHFSNDPSVMAWFFSQSLRNR
ncbi:MAG: hypothetical protein KA369_13495 [Spirochaetes bacterium]|nr:hypothetical protein [Spirochaetota bacterium]